jgi:hypothetical protein
MLQNAQPVNCWRRWHCAGSGIKDTVKLGRVLLLSFHRSLAGLSSGSEEFFLIFRGIIPQIIRTAVRLFGKDLATKLPENGNKVATSNGNPEQRYTRPAAHISQRCRCWALW